MPNDKDISYLLDNINRKCVLVVQDAVCPKCKARMSNKALGNVDSIMADVEKIRGRLPNRADVENADAGKELLTRNLSADELMRSTRSLSDADSTPNTQTENAEAEGQQT